MHIQQLFKRLFLTENQLKRCLFEKVKGLLLWLIFAGIK